MTALQNESAISAQANVISPAIANYTRLLEMIGERNKLEILYLLYKEGELPVGTIQSKLGFTQAKTTRHILPLQAYGVIAERRTGQWYYKSIHPDYMRFFKGLFGLVDKVPGK